MYNVKRLAVIESHVCVYVMHYFMYYIYVHYYKKQAERGCFFNKPFQRLIPESNGKKKCVENGYKLLWIGFVYIYMLQCILERS